MGGNEGHSGCSCASGKSNRIVVSSIAAGSSQEAVQKGDNILSLNGQAVYSHRDFLQEADSNWNELTVEREGELVTLSMPGGPTGFRTERRREIPGIFSCR